MSYDYDVIIIGGGSGGLMAARLLGSRGLRVLLVEAYKLGGGSLWYGTVPSKALVAAARRIREIQTAQELGLPRVDIKPSFEKLTERMRSAQALMEIRDSVESLREIGVTVRFGAPRFTGRHTLIVDQQSISFRYAIIATGSVPDIPSIPGLPDAVITTQQIFSIPKLPKRLVIIGGGPQGTEMAQVFARFGSKVTIISRHGLLPREDPDLSRDVEYLLRDDGVDIINGEVTAVEDRGNYKIVHVTRNRKEEILVADIVFCATGRKANIYGLGLDEIGVKHTAKGISVDKHCRTTARSIFAIGDVIGGLLFGHMAESNARLVVHNMFAPRFLPFLRHKQERIVPWVTFTDPELARVGLTETEAIQKEIPHEVLTHLFMTNDRAICEQRYVGKIKVIVSPGGKILGASILGMNGGEILQEYVFAMRYNLSIEDIAATIHPYPTYGVGNWLLAGKERQKNLTPSRNWAARFLLRM